MHRTSPLAITRHISMLPSLLITPQYHQSLSPLVLLSARLSPSVHVVKRYYDLNWYNVMTSTHPHRHANQLICINTCACALTHTQMYAHTHAQTHTKSTHKAISYFSFNGPFVLTWIYRIHNIIAASSMYTSIYNYAWNMCILCSLLYTKYIQPQGNAAKWRVVSSSIHDTLCDTWL